MRVTVTLEIQDGAVQEDFRKALTGMFTGDAGDEDVSLVLDAVESVQGIDFAPPAALDA